MGKTMVYIATAILLGVVSMLPVIVLTPKSPETTELGHYAIEGDGRLLLEGDVERSLKEEFGIARVPLSPLHLGLIFVVSFVFASGVSFYFKRKMF